MSTLGVPTHGADPSLPQGDFSTRSLHPLRHCVEKSAALLCALALLVGCQSAPEVERPTVTPISLEFAHSEQAVGVESDSVTVPLTTSLTDADTAGQGVAQTEDIATAQEQSLTTETGESLTASATLSSTEGITDTLPRETPTPRSPEVIVLAPNEAPTIPPTPTPLPTPEIGIVMQVVNGDTLLVNIANAPTLVGYLLVDAPDLDTPLGELALQVNRALVEGEPVRLVRDISDIDRDHRRLRLVYLDDGTLVNSELLRQGWAQVQESPLDTAYEAEFRTIEEGARTAGVGMWAGLVNAVTNVPVELRTGPDLTFTVAQTLPVNSILNIDGVTTDLSWYRLEGGLWLPSQSVTNPPEVGAAAYVAVDTPVPTPTVTQTPTPTATPTVSPTPTFAIGSVQIQYVDKDDEWLVIRNGTNRLLDLTDWKVLSERGGEICILAGQLAPLATMTVWTQWGPDFACNMEFPMWDDLLDDAAVLYSPSGFVIHRYEDPMNTRPPEEGGRDE